MLNLNITKKLKKIMEEKQKYIDEIKRAMAEKKISNEQLDNDTSRILGEYLAFEYDRLNLEEKVNKSLLFG